MGIGMTHTGYALLLGIVSLWMGGVTLVMVYARPDSAGTVPVDVPWVDPDALAEQVVAGVRYQKHVLSLVDDATTPEETAPTALGAEPPSYPEPILSADEIAEMRWAADPLTAPIPLTVTLEKVQPIYDGTVTDVLRAITLRRTLR